MSWNDLESTLHALVPELRTIRHDLHKHPELGFEEVRTQALIKSWLLARGYTPQVSAKTGLYADLHPTQHGSGPTIALRADIDCLPMQEHTELPYRSVHNGRAHKCGHDGHTAILLGVADLLARHREQIAGNVRLVFQPAEEGALGGGAKVMVAEGILKGVDEIYGLHSWPGYPLGDLRVCAGPIMAQVHSFEITIVGKGGHGSQPQLCRDPIVAGAQLVSALQTVVSRDLGYEGGAVLSVTAFQAGTTDNVIPERARLLGTIRSFAPAVSERVLKRMQTIQEGIAATFEVDISCELTTGYPVLTNHPRCTAAVVRVGAAILGDARVSDAGLPMAGGEDFAYFASHIPAAYFFLGAKLPGQDTPVCHHPDFDFDDSLIPVGIRLFVGLVHDRLGTK